LIPPQKDEHKGLSYGRGLGDSSAGAFDLFLTMKIPRFEKCQRFTLWKRPWGIFGKGLEIFQSIRFLMFEFSSKV
jgi:hypothetical protein